MPDTTRPTDDPGTIVRVLIADDHPVVRSGLRAMLDAPGTRVVGEAATGCEAADQAAALEPDVVLMDIRMPDIDGLAATRLVKEGNPTISVIIVTSFESQDYLKQAIEAGAVGYLLKGASRSLLLDSIRIVREGGSMFEASLLADLLVAVAHRDVAAEGALDDLTARERAALKLVEQGMTNIEIATRMGYSAGTIKNTVQQLIAKLGVSDRTQAAVLGVRAGLEID